MSAPPAPTQQSSADYSKNGPYSVFVTLRIHPERVPEFVQIILADQKASLQTEPGVLAFNVIRDEHEAEVFHLFEVYKSIEAAQAHMQTAHWRAWDAFRNSGGVLSQEERTGWLMGGENL